MQTKEKTRLASLRDIERSTLCKEYGKFVNTCQEAVQFKLKVDYAC